MDLNMLELFQQFKNIQQLSLGLKIDFFYLCKSNQLIINNYNQYSIITKKFFILVSLMMLAAIGYAQVPTVQFILQPDGTFKTSDGKNSVAFDCKSMTTADIGPRFRMAARLCTNGECCYEEGYGLTIQNNFVYPVSSTEWGYNVNFAIQIDAYKKKIRVMAPVITHFAAIDKTMYNWYSTSGKSVSFKNDGSRKQESFSVEELINKNLNDILAVVYQDPNN